MESRTIRAGGADLALVVLGSDSPEGIELIWAHGWGHTHRNMLPLAEAMRHSARSVLLDLPGFGASPPPAAPWGTADYADAIAEWLAGCAGPLHPYPDPRPHAGEGRVAVPVRRIWVGHSFGCRIGLQLAARHPELLDGLFLIAAAGLPPRRSFLARIGRAARRGGFRLARWATPEGPGRERLRDRFGSADYRAAGPLMRPILVKAVNEDLTPVARPVRLPVMLVVGDRDTEAPPEISERLHLLMPQSRLVVLRGFDHLNVLTEGRHQLVQRLAEFVEQLG